MASEECATLKISDLLEQARAAEAIVLPEDVRIKMCPYDVVRLRLLTFRHMIALADYAAENADRWHVLKLHYLNPNLKQETIADLTGTKKSTVKYWIHNAVITADIWEDVPVEA